MTTFPGAGAGLHRIVVGVDGSPGAQRALGWAAARSCETGAELLAVHVLTFDRELALDVSPASVTNWRRTLQADVAGRWTEAARAAGARVRAYVVEADSAAAGLLAAADEEKADLLVLGAHGQGTLADRLLGATTYRVAHRAHIPVVVIPPEWTGPATG